MDFPESMKEHFKMGDYLGYLYSLVQLHTEHDQIQVQLLQSLSELIYVSNTAVKHK